MTSYRYRYRVYARTNLKPIRYKAILEMQIDPFFSFRFVLLALEQ